MHELRLGQVTMLELRLGQATFFTIDSYLNRLSCGFVLCRTTYDTICVNVRRAFTRLGLGHAAFFFRSDMIRLSCACRNIYDTISVNVESNQGGTGNTTQAFLVVCATTTSAAAAASAAVSTNAAAAFTNAQQT